MSSPPKPEICEHCGANDFEALGSGRFKCAYCGTILTIPGSEPAILIRKGANVVFARNSKVVLNGTVEIESGANVQVLGELTGKASRRKPPAKPASPREQTR